MYSTADVPRLYRTGSIPVSWENQTTTINDEDSEDVTKKDDLHDADPLSCCVCIVQNNQAKRPDTVERVR